MKKTFLLLALCLGVFTSCVFEEKVKAQTEQTEIENLEIPQSKQTNNEIILHHKGYSVGYNTDNLLPNWVAWELYKEKLTEDASRYKKFLPDPDLPKEYAITTHEYTHSGWNRGHMCPAADNKWDADAMKESFYTPLICSSPQWIRTSFPSFNIRHIISLIIYSKTIIIITFFSFTSYYT